MLQTYLPISSTTQAGLKLGTQPKLAEPQILHLSLLSVEMTGMNHHTQLLNQEVFLPVSIILSGFLY